MTLKLKWKYRNDSREYLSALTRSVPKEDGVVPVKLNADDEVMATKVRLAHPVCCIAALLRLLIYLPSLIQLYWMARITNTWTCAQHELPLPGSPLSVPALLPSSALVPSPALLNKHALCSLSSSILLLPLTRAYTVIKHQYTLQSQPASMQLRVACALQNGRRA